MFKKILTISIFLTLAGCAQRQNQQSQYYSQQMSLAQANRNQLANTVKNANEAVESCTNSLQDDPATKIVYDQIIIRRIDSPNKLQLLSSQAKLNQSQIAALTKAWQLGQNCRQIHIDRLSDYPTIAKTRKDYYSDMDIVYANLLSKKITIGEANLKKVELMNRSANEGSAAYQKIIDGYNGRVEQARVQAYQAQQQDQARREADNERSRLAAAAFLQNMSNQKAAQAQTYQNQAVPPAYVPSNNNPFYSTPQQPIQSPTVNCNPNGLGGFRCQ